MPSTISGDKANVTAPLRATIIGASNATPIVIQTSAPHLYSTGDQVAISQVLGNIAANADVDAPWTVTVQDSTHFALNGSVGSGAYTSGGTALDLSLTPNFADPSDGDFEDAESVAIALQGLCDRTQWLSWRLATAWHREGAVAALNWMPVIAQTVNLIAAAWDTRGVWWGVSHGTVDQAGQSTDNGTHWSSIAPGSSSIALQSIAVDSLGNAVTVGPGAVLYQFNGSTWANESPGYGSGVVDAVVVYEPTAVLWAVYSNNTLSGHTIATLYTSPDRVTWTARTLPAAVVGDGTHAVVDKVHMGVGGGRIVIGLMLAGVAFMSSAAASAPTVWSSAATLTPTLTCAQMTDPVYVDSLATWLVGLRRTSSTTGVEIWASTDGGATWAKRATLGGTTHSNPTVQLAALGSVVAALTTGGAIQYSTDAGYTWYPGPTVGTLAATARSIWPGDGGFLELDTGGSADGSSASIHCGAFRRSPVLA